MIDFMENEKVSKQELAYINIKKSIINNEFPPDTPLTENYLCNKYGFSRTPVREALRRLTSEGFVDFIRDKGAFVAQISFEDLKCYYEVREALEGMAAKLCAMRITDSAVIELSGLLEKIIENFEIGNYVQAMIHDMDFHRCIIRESKNQKLESIMNTVIDLISCVAYKADKTIISESINDHKIILHAIKTSDDMLAESAMREHILHSKKFHFDRYFYLK